MEPEKAQWEAPVLIKIEIEETNSLLELQFHRSAECVYCSAECIHTAASLWRRRLAVFGRWLAVLRRAGNRVWRSC